MPVETTIVAAVFEVTVCETNVTPATPDRLNGLPLQVVFVPVRASVTLVKLTGMKLGAR